jgi:hypothetical protein
MIVYGPILTLTHKMAIPSCRKDITHLINVYMNMQPLEIMHLVRFPCLQKGAYLQIEDWTITLMTLTFPLHWTLQVV